MDIGEWRKEFLGNRGFAAPTGNPLFTYRMTKNEFHDLEIRLRDYLENNLRFNSLGEIARDDKRFCMTFVLYASEWWKRRFDGHQWAWTPILRDIGADPDDWSQSRRSACVEEGFALWNIDLGFSTGFHYLANIAFHGGLPIQLISEARGGIGRILSHVMRTATGVEETSVLAEWVASLASPLPQAYRRDEIYRLLATIAQTIIELKNTANLTRSEGAVEKLDSVVPGWRERLPISLDDSQAAGLIDQLVSEAAAGERKQATGSGLRVERRLELVGEGLWRIHSTLEFDAFIEAEKLKRQFNLPGTWQEQLLTLTVLAGEVETNIGLRRIAGQDRYRLDRRDGGRIGYEAIGDHSLRLSTRNGETYHSPLVQGCVLEDDAPWVFSMQSPSSTEGMFLRQRGGKIPTQQALICIPEDWRFENSNSDKTQDCGLLEAIGRKIWMVEGITTICDPSGTRFTLICGLLEEEYSYDLRGPRIWDYFVSPQAAFSGIPRLERTDLETGAISMFPVTHWRYRGGPWQSSSDGLLGPVYGQYATKEDLLWRGKLLLLPDGFRIHLEGGEDTRTGVVVLQKSGICSLSVEGTEVTAMLEQREGAIFARLRVGEGLEVPEFVDFKVVWPRNPEGATIRLPFPSRGIVIYAADGRRLLSGSKVALRELTGMKIVAFSPKIGRGFISLRNKGLATGSMWKGISRSLDFNADIRRIEIRLVDYIHDIRRMLSLSDSLDAEVDIELSIPDCEPVGLIVSHYGATLEIEESEGKVGLEQYAFARREGEELERTNINALRLNALGSEPMPLAPIHSQGVHCGRWSFPAEKLDPGPWLIMPEKESPYDFRPILWHIEYSNVRDLVTAKGSLLKAIGTIDNGLRLSKLNDAIYNMVQDPNDDGWRHAEWLASQTGHLHLAVLDLWRCLARSGSAMAILTFRMGSLRSEFIQRFPEELPFLWEFVPLRSWIAALFLAFRQTESLPESVRNIVRDAHVQGRKDTISTGNPSMVSVLELVLNMVREKENLYTFHRQMQKEAPQRRDMMFSGTDSEYQKLLRRHLGDQWPTYLFDEQIEVLLASKYKNLCRIDQSSKFRSTVLNTPAILAAASCGLVDFGWTVGPDLVSKVRIVRDFDPEWFSVAYASSIIRCLAMRDDLQSLVEMEDQK